MDNNQELFDGYINETLSAEEKANFDKRLSSDKSFASDFRVYLLTLEGICKEAEENDMEFGIAMKNIPEEELLKIMGRDKKRHLRNSKFIRERFAWVASIAAVIAIGIFSVINLQRSSMNKLDDLIVAYNYIPDSNRGPEDFSSQDIPSLENAYRTAPSDDIQAQEDAGMRLAMAYLKMHDRKKAKELLKELSLRFAQDEEFHAQCQRILSELE